MKALVLVLLVGVVSCIPLRDSLDVTLVRARGECGMGECGMGECGMGECGMGERRIGNDD